MSLFEYPRKRADIKILYSSQTWYWWCLQCDEVGGKADDPENLGPLIVCGRCGTRYGEVFDYPLVSKWTEYLYHYEFLPPLIFQVNLADPN